MISTYWRESVVKEFSQILYPGLLLPKIESTIANIGCEEDNWHRLKKRLFFFKLSLAQLFVPSK